MGYNWRASVNATYNYIIICQLIGSAGNFTGVTIQYAYPAPPPDSPTGFFEIPLPTDAKGLSFAVFAGVQTAPNQYTLVTLQNKIVQVRSPEVFLTAIFPAISDMEH